MERSGRLAQAATLVALTGVYFAAGKLGLSLAFAHPSASPVWPSSGIALAAVLLLGKRVWPAVFAGALLVNLDAGRVAASLGIATGNTLEAVVGGWLVKRFARGAEAFEHPRDVFRFVVVVGLLATPLGATVGMTSLTLTGLASWPQYGQLWLTWWLGDAGGTLIVAPALICWITGEPFACGRARLIEAIAFLATLSAVGTLTFFSSDPLKFLCLPPVIWAAFRLGPRGTAAAVLILSTFATWGVYRSIGDLPSGEENRALLLLQVFLGVISVTGLTMAAVVAERRRAQEALEWQAQELERSNAELASFAHVVSHDLKAPLRGIESLAVWIVEDNKDLLAEESAEQLRLLEGRTKRMGKLIDGVLAYSRVARTRRVPERVDAGVVVAEVIDSLGPTRATIRVEGTLPGIRYDRTQLAQVFQNLIVNAVQHMGRDDGEIAVSCQDRHEVFEFAVRDDGVGIEDVHAERIFRMFQALQPERETAGVGLSIVKKIVEAHGGAIRVEPTPGGGATFRFSVPKQPRDRARERA
jgi:signal transduction histidine kinase